VGHQWRDPQDERAVGGKLKADGTIVMRVEADGKAKRWLDTPTSGNRRRLAGVIHEYLTGKSLIHRAKAAERWVGGCASLGLTAG
jgi:hypothetical protein